MTWSPFVPIVGASIEVIEHQGTGASAVAAPICSRSQEGAAA